MNSLRPTRRRLGAVLSQAAVLAALALPSAPLPASAGGGSVVVVPGCAGNPAVLTSLAPTISIGTTASFHLQTGGLVAGLAVLYVGLDGTDSAGCGFVVPGVGELLLAPAPQPTQLVSGLLALGASPFDVPVPDVPAWVGVPIAVQGGALDVFDPAHPVEVSNALAITLAP